MKLCFFFGGVGGGGNGENFFLPLTDQIVFSFLKNIAAIRAYKT